MKMKKIIALLTSFFFLVSCGPNQNTPVDPQDPSDPGEPTDPSDPSDPTDPTDPTDPQEPESLWDIEIREMFDAYLNGYELPYLDGTVLGLGELDVVYSRQYDAIMINGGDIETLEPLNNLESLLVAAGFEVVESPNMEVETRDAEEETKPYYYLTADVDLKEKGVHHISVEFGSVVDKYDEEYQEYYTEFELPGEFMLLAYDPYLYEFPSELIGTMFEAYGAEGVTVPAYAGANNYYYFAEDPYNALYEYYGILEYINYYLYVFGTNADEFGAYLTALEGASWMLEEKEDEDGVYYAGTFAIDEESEVSLIAYYSEENEAAVLNFYPYVEGPEQPVEVDADYDVWPTADLDTLMAAIFPEATDKLPELPNAAGYDLYSSEEKGVVEVVAYGTTSGEAKGLVSSYLDILEDAGWTFSYNDSWGDPVYASPNGQIQVNVYTDENAAVLDVTAYVAPVTEWPAEDIAAAIASVLGATETLPALVGEGLKFDISTGSKAVQIKVAADNPEELKDSYLDVLEDAGWTFLGNDSYGDPNYLSPNEQLNVNVWVNSAGTALYLDVTAYVAPVTEWPAEEIAAGLQSVFPGTTDTLPALDGANNYELSSSSYGYTIKAYFSSEELEDAKDAYIDVLEDAGWTFSHNDSWGDPYYISPNGQLEVNVWVSTYSNCVYLSVYAYEEPTPVEYDYETLAECAAYLEGEYNAGGQDTILTTLDCTVEGVNLYEGDDGIQVQAYVSDYEDLQDVVDAYGEALLAAGFTAGTPDEYGDITYTSPNGEFTLAPWQYDSYYEGIFFIDFESLAEPEPVAWPAEDIADALAYMFPEFTGTIPAVEGATDYVVGSFPSYGKVQIKAFGADKDAVAAMKEAYLDVLEDAGWEIVGYDSYDNSPYLVSPDGTIQMNVWGTSTLYIDISAYVAPLTEWPAEDVAELLGNDITDAIPSYEGNGYELLNDSYGTAVVVYVEAGTEEDAVAAYEDILLDAGWTLYGTDSYGDNIYLSPNEQILVCPYFGTAGSITIAFQAYVAPSEPVAVAEAIALALAEVDAEPEFGIPTVEGMLSASPDIEDYYGAKYITIYTEEGNEQATVDAFNAAMEALGYEGDEDSYGDMEWYSPDGLWFIQAYYAGNSGEIYVYFYYFG